MAWLSSLMSDGYSRFYAVGFPPAIIRQALLFPFLFERITHETEFDAADRAGSIGRWTHTAAGG